MKKIILFIVILLFGFSHLMSQQLYLKQGIAKIGQISQNE